MVCIGIGLLSFVPVSKAETVIDNSSKLLDLARKRFGVLSPAEEKLFQAVVNGSFVDYSAKKPEDNDLSKAESWPAERSLKSDRITWLCTDKEALGLVMHKGIQIIGVRIDGELDLQFTKIAFPLVIMKCAILSGIDLRHAEIRMISLYGTYVGQIKADSLKVDGDVLLFKGFKAVSGVRLVGATIGGQLGCDNGEFVNPNGYALEASSLKVESGVFLRDGFKAEGEVCLTNATIGELDCNNGEFINPNGTALNADGLKVAGNVLLRNGFKAKGKVDLRGATIGGQLTCIGGQFINPNGKSINADSLKIEESILLSHGFKAKGEVCLVGATIGGQLSCNNGQFINPDGDAIIADELKVAGNVFFSVGFKAKGKVRLHSTIIGGDLTCDGGQFINPKGEAFDGDSLKVEGNFFLRKGFRADGEVYLVGATIGRQLACTGGQFINPNGKAINADSLKVKGSVFLNDGFKAEGKIDLVNAEIGGCFKWHKVDSPGKVTLDLRFATVGILNDEPNSWPNKGKLLLNGLTYSDFFDNCPKDAESRIEWIRRQYNKKSVSFHPQPYEQLAEVLQKNGHENDAKKVLVTKNKDKVKWGPKLTFSECLWYRIFGPMIGYGNRPLWAFYKGLCGVWFVGSILFWILVGWILFLIEHRKYPAIDSTNNKSPKFNSLVYSIDTFVPLVNLYQAKYWLPKGRCLRLYHWTHIVFGWILTTLLVLGLTGLIRK